MRVILYLFLAFFMIGCDNVEQRFDPYKKQVVESDKDIELKKLDTNSMIELAKIDAQKAQTIKEIEAKNQVDVANIQKEVSLKEQDVVLKTQDEKSSLYQKIAILIAVVIVVLILAFVYINKKNRELAFKIKQEEIQKERDLHKEACYNERINKMLEIVASNSADKQIKEQLVEILKNSKSTDNLLEHKK